METRISRHPEAEPSDFYRRILGLLDANEPVSSFEKLNTDVSQLVAVGELPGSMVEDLEIALRLHDNFENKLKRERELSALYETARDLSALRNPDQVLKAIVQRARQLVGSDIAYLSAADDERNDFFVKATEGVISQDFARIRVPRDVGVCGSVARTRRPFYSSNYSVDPAFAHDSFIDQATQGEGVVSILGIPLEVEAHVIGVLFVGDRYVRSYTPQEMAVLSSLGTFAALAIENARLLEEARRALQAAKDANAALKAKADDVEDAAAAHEQLTELVARGGTLDDLTRRVGNILHGQAVVLDERQKPITGAMPDHFSEQMLMRAVRESDRLGRSVQVHCDDGGVALVAAAIGGTARLGSLIFKRQRSFSASEIRTFERSAIVTGIVLLSMERIAQLAHKSATDAISALVRGTTDPFASGAMRQLPGAVAITWPVTMMMVDLADVSFIQVAGAARAALSGRDTIFAEFNGDLLIVTNGERPRDIAAALQERLREAVRRDLTIVISRPVEAIGEATAQYEALRRCLGLLRRLGQTGRVAFESALAMYGLVFADKQGDAIDAFIRGTLGPVIEHDMRKGTQLARTLLAYLDGGRSLQKAAEHIGIHVNTMRQRLDLVGQLNPDCLNPLHGLETHVALRMHALKQAE
ncbi:GAF domain-containing protein [Mesorhizobium sp. CAU 1741]|uniref:helix-turn-helix domain-containing protein n=1 Tax=Mesorhizobium sp. CAU 1741 TaxID=3140366 RepID=UPI00325BFDF8